MTESESTTSADESASTTATTTDGGRTATTDGGRTTINDERATPPEPERANRNDDRLRNTADELDVRTYLYRGALVVLVLLAVVALFQFYMSALNVIRTFVASQYRSLFNAIFNLVVLLAAGIGISFVIREMD
ncbi:hypothetical protein [Haladaptatus sp. CMAA 1911]|uniref:hypothetical protein n=1 Tax=unclassified Haladaptatus TaxID=2622732 RepID=UPI0037540C66